DTAATATFRVFNIDGPGAFTVTLSGMTITGGNTTGTAGAGTSGDGAGILVNDETLTLTDAAVVNNTSATEGGGIAVDAGGSLTVRKNTHSRKTARSTPPGRTSAAGGGVPPIDDTGYRPRWMKNSRARSAPE